MREFEAVKLISTHDTGFIISIDRYDFCRVVGEKIDMWTPMQNLKSLGFTLQEYLAQNKLVNDKA